MIRDVTARVGVCGSLRRSRCSTGGSEARLARRFSRSHAIHQVQLTDDAGTHYTSRSDGSSNGLVRIAFSPSVPHHAAELTIHAAETTLTVPRSRPGSQIGGTG
jgi:hypothetical protein